MLENWALIECDFQERYGIDLSPRLLERRSGRWLSVRIVGLIVVESRLRLALFPEEEGDS